MYKIDQDIFHNNFMPNGGAFKHVTNTKFKDLPFVAKDRDVVKDFSGVIGEYVRILLGKTLKDDIESEELLDQLVANVECGESDQYALRQILKSTYFKENGDIYLFSSKVIAYSSATTHDKKIAQFLYDVLNIQGLDDSISQCFESQANNVMDQLMYESLPELPDRGDQGQIYKRMLPYVSQRFMEDFAYILQDQETVRKYLKSLLEYYYFFYVNQLAIKFSRMFDAQVDKVEELFFSVEWEKLSKSRKCYEFGWKKAETCSRKLFSHSKLLEILNQNSEDALEEKIDYLDIARVIDQLEYSSFEQEVNESLSFYISQINDYDLTQVERSEKYSSKLLNDLLHFYNCIDAQFIASKTRNRAYTAYSNWFIEFSKANWLKNRRSLGYTLNLREEDIIFLTKIVIKDREKMKLKDLFEGYEQRGIFLDHKSKEEIHNYFEKLNLIEKKSDSGDAQYVKGIL